MYELIICPIKKLYMCAEDGDMSDVAVLAVSSYDINQEKLKVFDKRICLNFDDVTDVKDISAFSKNESEQIAHFIRKLPRNLDTLFVCCDSGESRSTAMAAAIARYNNSDEMKIWLNPHYHPNPLVYKSLCDSLGVCASEKEVADKVAANQKAFSDAINGCV